MKDINLNNLVGQLSSYFTAGFMIAHDAAAIANWLLAAIPALAGAYLTFRIAKLRKAQAESIVLENEKKKLELEILKSKQ